jgi:hypothetical protein
MQILVSRYGRQYLARKFQLSTNLLASVSESEGPWSTKDFTMLKEKTTKVVPLFEAVKRDERLVEESDLNPRQRALK